MARLLRIVLIAVALGVAGNIVLALVTTKRDALVALSGFAPWHIALVTVLALAPWVGSTLRLQLWSDALGATLSFRAALRTVIGTQLGQAVSPTAIGGAPVKIALLAESGHSAGSAASLTTLSSVEDFLTFAVLIPIGIAVSEPWDIPAVQAVVHAVPGQIATIAVIAVVTTVAVVAATLILRSLAGAPRWVSRVVAHVRTIVSDAVSAYRVIGAKGRYLLPVTLLVNAVQWVARYAIISVLALALGVPVDFALFFVLQWVVFSFAILIPTPGAAGGAEATFAAVYAGLIPGSILGIATASWRFFTFYLPLLVGALVFPILSGYGSQRVQVATNTTLMK